MGPLDPPLQAFCVCTSSGASVEDQIDLNFVPFTLAPGMINVGLGLVRRYSVGYLEIASRDPDMGPEIKLQLFSHPEDLQRTVTGVKLLRSIFAQPASAGYAGDEQWPGPDAVSDKAIADAIMAPPTTYAHVLGTCSMGAGRRGLGGRRPAREEARPRGPAHRRRVDHADDPGRAAEHDRDHDGGALR